MNKTHMAIALAMGALSAVPADAQVRPDVLVRQRQAVMTLQGKYFYPIRNMARGKVPYDANIVARNVGYVDALSKMPWDGFAATTKGVKSGAMATVFTDPGKFKESQDQFQAEFARLSDVVRKGGDEAAIKSQIIAVDKSCESCHETFRERQ